MTNAHRPAHITLEDWETWLSPHVGRVELLGEIPITADECAQLGKVIGLRVQALGHTQALRALRHDYPCAFAVYLVAQGVIGYHGGDNWSEVTEVTGFSHARTSTVGRAFEGILERLRLPLFPDMREGAQRYVSLILAHGGIPNYCLPDFFDRILQPLVVRADYDGMSAREAIDERLSHASSMLFADKPVVRFLEFGGEVAEDFVQRSWEMALTYLDTGLTPDAAELGLPARVVDAYRQWIAEQTEDKLRRDTRDRWRLRRPEVLVDPWGEGVLLQLTPQRIPATALHAEIAWRVVAGDLETLLPVGVRRIGFDRQTESYSVPLRRPAEVYQVALLVDGEAKRTWRFAGPSDRCPLVVFDPERGSLVQWQRSLPARHLGLLHPHECELETDGKAVEVEQLPRLPFGWAGFEGGIWDLTGSESLVLRRDGEAVVQVMLRPDEAALRPQLAGGQQVAAPPADRETAVYVGRPPFIRIPLTGRGGLIDELARWRLTVSNRWPAVPALRETTTLADLHEQAEMATRSDEGPLPPAAIDRHIDLPLDLPGLLGAAPRGNYEVQLRGPLGRDATLTLRILPHVVICGDGILYIPTVEEGPQPASLLVEVLADDGVECQVEEGDCQVDLVDRRGEYWDYGIQIGPGATTAELSVVRSLPSGDAVRVPIPVSVRRLRWALADQSEASGRREWTGRPVSRPIEALLQSQSPCLLVTLPLDGPESAALQLRLLDVDQTELQVLDPVSPRRGGRPWRFELAGMLDTIRASHSPVLRIELMIWGLPGQETPVHTRVLSLTQALAVDHVALSAHRADGRAVFELRWHEEAPLRSRHVRFWPLWRPWDPVYELPVPDETGDAYSFEVDPARLRSGKYRVEFLVVDPWAPPETPKKPPEHAPNTADVELITPERQLRSLDARVEKSGATFDTTLERAYVRYDTLDLERSASDRQWCYEHLDQGTIPQVLSLADLVQAGGDRAALSALQLKMYASSRVERLLRAKDQNQVAPEHFQRYLDLLPRSGLLARATCQQLLSVDDETVRLHAVQQLVRRKDPLGVETVLAWVDEARLSDADAIAVLELNAEFSADCLQEQRRHRLALRLLGALSKELGDRTPLVEPGTWMYSDAGWGRIECIQDLDGGPVSQFIVGEAAYRLRVILRPALDAEPIDVDLSRKLITFTEADPIYTCTKCNGCSARYPGLIVSKHDRAAHGGIGPQYRKERITRRSLRTVKYSARPPGQAGLGSEREN